MNILRTFEILIKKKPQVDEAPGELLVYPIPLGSPKHPEWFETYMVEDKDTLEFLGFVGRLGMSKTWEWDDGNHSRGKGRAKSRDEAVLRLHRWAIR